MTKKLVVLCDGSWCGRATGTETNISIIAKAIGIEGSLEASDDTPQTFEYPDKGLKACYFSGAGMGGTFLEYLFNGATASDIGKLCREVYQYIVENFDEHTEIWMFGLSRGCYTVRCVGGMLNNCGIVRARSTTTETIQLVEEVYDMYRSQYPEDKPASAKAQEFRAKASWNVESPIKVMALIDTVGSLGIPKLNAGIGFDWPEFYDQDISSEVQRVYHACSIHDRLWMFQPCRAMRSEQFREKYKNDKRFVLDERWFPGCHYDLGRQKFKFLRNGVNVVENFFFTVANFLTKPVVPNAVCADLVLHWFYQIIRDNDPKDQILRAGAALELARLEQRMRGSQATGSGDVYSSMPDFTPLGLAGAATRLSTAAISLADQLTPSVQIGSAISGSLGVRSLMSILLATRNRRIQDVHATVLDLHARRPELGDKSAYEKGALDRYPSITLEKLALRKDVMQS